MRFGKRRGHDAPRDAPAIGTDGKRVLRIAVLIGPQPLHDVERLLGGAPRAVILGIDAQAGRLDARPAAADAEEDAAIRQLVEEVHAFDQRRGLKDRNRQPPETEYPMGGKWRRNVAGDLHVLLCYGPRKWW